MSETNNQTNNGSETESNSDSDNDRQSRPGSANRERLNSILDPSYAPKILRKNRSISRAESSGSLVNESKVLVLYTGGTIGMMRSSKGVYAPQPNGALEAELRRYPQLHDTPYAAKHFHRLPEQKSPLVLPDTGEATRIVYTIYEYEPLLDSSNMTVDDWINIALDIQHCYHHFNGFVILHGTDTMAYTASALSFMLENLGKTVVITGSQIPLFEPRSDGRENFLNSLIMAGNYCIPEVTILFNNRLLRGNRTSKLSTSDLNAFDSPNMQPLATIGIHINIEWNNVFRSPTIAKFCVHPLLSRNVGLLRLFPSITVETVRAFLAPPIEGVVLQSYGAGNAPSNRADILNEFKDASNRGVIIVNITQCLTGKVTAAYETGNALLEAGVICGSDMTPEACLTKLSYVLSKSEMSIDEKRKVLEANIRGELSTYLDTKYDDIELIRAIAQTLKISHKQELTALKKALYPAIVCAIAAKGDVQQLDYLKKTGADLCAPDYDLRTPLHIAVSNGHVEVVDYLLGEGANVHAKDKNNETPLQLAVKNDYRDIIALLRQAGAYLDLGAKVANSATKAAANGDITRLESLCLAGADLNASDQFGRTCLHVAVEKNDKDVVRYLVNDKGVNRSKSDVYGRNAEKIAQYFNDSDIIDILRQSESNPRQRLINS